MLHRPLPPPAPSDQICPFDIVLIFNKHTSVQWDENCWITGGQAFKTIFLIIMNYAQTRPFIPIFVKVVVNKSKLYSFLIISMVYLQWVIFSVRMLRFHLSLPSRAIEYIKPRSFVYLLHILNMLKICILVYKITSTGIHTVQPNPTLW